MRPVQWLALAESGCVDPMLAFSSCAIILRPVVCSWRLIQLELQNSLTSEGKLAKVLEGRALFLWVVGRLIRCA